MGGGGTLGRAVMIGGGGTGAAPGWGAGGPALGLCGTALVGVGATAPGWPRGYAVGEVVVICSGCEGFPALGLCVVCGVLSLAVTGLIGSSVWICTDILVDYALDDQEEVWL